jgi:hypothetical protein
MWAPLQGKDIVYAGDPSNTLAAVAGITIPVAISIMLPTTLFRVAAVVGTRSPAVLGTKLTTTL